MLPKPAITFNTIGGGEVLAKYFLPVLAKNPKFKLNTVLSRGTRRDFQKFLRKSPYERRYRNFPLEKIAHMKTNGLPNDLYEKLHKVSSESEPVFILTPPQTHLPLVRKFVTSSAKKIYLDKPAVTNLEEYRELVGLIIKYPHRIYLAEQYFYGRAKSLLENYHLYKASLGDILRVELFLEEGQRYFEATQKWKASIKEEGGRYFDLTGSWFANVGPELDLSVHLLATLFFITGPSSTYKVASARQPKGYLENYGVESEILIQPFKHPEFPVLIRCGKRHGANNRSFKIICQNGQIWQQYTSQVCRDPVYLKIGQRAKRICQYPKGYTYFYSQMVDFAKWLTQDHDQTYVLKALECALNIKAVRKVENNFRIIAMIPARMDNQILKKKHIREMAGKPMIYYAIKAALDSKIFDQVYVNSESNIIGSIGQKLGASFYKRDPKLAEAGINNEEFVFDFLQHVNTEYLFMINPNKPLISPEEIRAFVEAMIVRKLDVMFSTEQLKTQVFYQDKPINFDLDKPHLRSTQIEPVQAIQWTITGWRAKTFLEAYREKGHAVYSGKLGLFPVSPDANFSVKQERDFLIAEKIMKLKS